MINGQKVWTSLAHVAQWAFVLCRTEPGSKRHQGLSFLLVPLDQPGVTVRPIQQLTGTSEFNEVFFDDAVTDADLVVGEPGDGWRVAMGLLTFERGVSTLGQQIGFARELQGVVDLAKANGAAADPNIREKIARAWVGLRVMRAHALRTLEAVDAGTSGAEASVAKLLWANWHRDLGQLAMEVQGAASLLAPVEAVVRHHGPRTSRTGRMAAAVPVHPRRHDLRRLQRDPAQHHLRARARTSPRGPFMTTTPLAAAPVETPGHDLLKGKKVVVTAAAGTGIGFATARRALLEGADVLVSDCHERRLARDQGEAGGRVPGAGGRGADRATCPAPSRWTR